MKIFVQKVVVLMALLACGGTMYTIPNNAVVQGHGAPQGKPLAPIVVKPAVAPKPSLSVVKPVIPPKPQLSVAQRASMFDKGLAVKIRPSIPKKPEIKIKEHKFKVEQRIKERSERASLLNREEVKSGDDPLKARQKLVDAKRDLEQRIDQKTEEIYTEQFKEKLSKDVLEKEKAELENMSNKLLRMEIDIHNFDAQHDRSLQPVDYSLLDHNKGYSNFADIERDVMAVSTVKLPKSVDKDANAQGALMRGVYAKIKSMEMNGTDLTVKQLQDGIDKLKNKFADVVESTPRGEKSGIKDTDEIYQKRKKDMHNYYEAMIIEPLEGVLNSKQHKNVVQKDKALKNKRLSFDKISDETFKSDENFGNVPFEKSKKQNIFVYGWSRMKTFLTDTFKKTFEKKKTTPVTQQGISQQKTITQQKSTQPSNSLKSSDVKMPPTDYWSGLGHEMPQAPAKAVIPTREQAFAAHTNQPKL